MIKRKAKPDILIRTGRVIRRVVVLTDKKGHVAFVEAVMLGESAEAAKKRALIDDDGDDMSDVFDATVAKLHVSWPDRSK